MSIASLSGSSARKNVLCLFRKPNSLSQFCHKDASLSPVSLGIFRRQPRMIQSASSNLIDDSVRGATPLIPRKLSAKRFSSVSKEPTGGISGWMERRKLSKEKERYQEQMERLASMEELTLESYKKELERGLSGWGASLSSLLQSKEVKMAKEVVSAVDGIIEVMGKDANVDELLEMTRLERLKVAAACNKTVEEVGILLVQIQNMDVMQRILRRRKLEGKPIPEDPTHLHNVIKNDALNVMTKTQKTVMKKRHQTIARSMARRKS